MENRAREIKARGRRWRLPKRWEGDAFAFLILRSQIPSWKPRRTPCDNCSKSQLPQGYEVDDLLPPLAIWLHWSKFASIQMTRHQMVGGYLLKLWLNLGALWHGEGTTGMDVAAGWRINR